MTPITGTKIPRYKAFERFADEASRTFKGSIRPVFVQIHRQKSKFIGTCTLVRYRNREFLVTAAHVFDERKFGHLFVLGMNGMIEISGQIAESIAPSKGRRLDKLDFACIILHKNAASQLGSSSFISEEDCMNNDSMLTKSYAAVLGYPRSKHKKWSSVKHKLRIKLYKYISKLVTEETIFEEIGFRSSTHCLLQFDRFHSKDSGGGQINSVSPRGVSGGGLFLMASPKEIEPGIFEGHCSFKLIGILIEQVEEHAVLVFTKISTIHEGMDAQLENLTRENI